MKRPKVIRLNYDRTPAKSIFDPIKVNPHKMLKDQKYAEKINNKLFVQSIITGIASYQIIK